jgi:hypothetical protein
LQPDTAGTAPAFRRNHSCGAPAEAHIRRQSNIYDLVEHAAARHGIPRLQLWQEVAKALTERKLAIQNDLSERPHPMGGPTLAEWLIDFRAAVDRYNDPNRRMVHILKRIIVRTVDFERWFRRANRLSRGPQPGTTGFQAADRRLLPKMRKLIKTGQARSPYSAGLLLVDRGLVPGNATRETKAKRLSKLYRQEEAGGR